MQKRQFQLIQKKISTASQGVYSPNDVLSVEELAAGIYFLRLEGYIKVEKLLVR